MIEACCTAKASRFSETVHPVAKMTEKLAVRLFAVQSPEVWSGLEND